MNPLKKQQKLLEKQRELDELFEAARIQSEEGKNGETPEEVITKHASSTRNKLAEKVAEKDR